MRTALIVAGMLVLISLFFVTPGPWAALARRFLEVVGIRKKRDRIMGSVEDSAAYFDQLAIDELVAAGIPYFSALIVRLGYHDARAAYYSVVKTFPRPLRDELDPDEIARQIRRVSRRRR